MRPKELGTKKFYLILSMLLVLIPGPISAQFIPHAPWRSNGKIFFARLNEASWNGTAGEVKDSSGRGNDGTSVSTNVTASGHLGNAGNFTGAGYLTIPDSPSLQFDSAFTISLWFKTSSATHTRMLTKGNWGEVGWQVTINDSTGKLRFGTDGFNLYTVTATYNDDVWHQVVVTYGNATARMYVDGVLVSVTTAVSGSCVATPTSGTAIAISGCTPGFNNTADPLVIGAYQGNSPWNTPVGTPQEHYTGSIDEVTIWNRQLDAVEITQIP